MRDTHIILAHAGGLETTGDAHTPIFVRGLHLPAAWSKMFLPSTNNQDEILIHVLQGDSSDARECTSIAKFTIGGLSPSDNSNRPEIMLTLEIDRQGALRCRARQLPDIELTTEGKPQQILVQPAPKFSGYGGYWGKA